MIKFRHSLVLSKLAIVFCLSPCLATAQSVRTVVVDPIADDAVEAGCTLREAVSLANAGLLEGVGCLAVAEGTGLPAEYVLQVPAMTYALTGGVDDSNLGGDLDIQAVVTIEGQGADQTIVDGSSIDRVMHVLNSNASLALRDITITGGRVERISHRGVVLDGGGLLVDGGSLTLDSVTVSDNLSRGVLGTIAGAGGGIANIDGRLRIDSSLVAGNGATGRGGGVFSEGMLTITNSVIEDNEANSGGGIHAIQGGSMANSVVRGNRSVGSGGGVQMTGIPGGPHAAILGSSITANTAGGLGGGIWTAGALDLANSTIALNRSSVRGGGLDFGSVSFFGSVNLTHVTVYRNSAADGGGGISGGSSGAAILSNTIIADNETDSGVDRDCNVGNSSLGSNLISRNDGCPISFPGGSPNVNGDFVGTTGIPLDPMLADSAGAPTIFEPLPSSIVIDQVALSDCQYQAGPGNPLFSDGDPVETDQRGAARNAPCDIGAVESVQLFMDGFEGL